MITLAPATAIIRAISRPIPPPEPVTTATFPSSRAAIDPSPCHAPDVRRAAPGCEYRRVSRLSMQPAQVCRNELRAHRLPKRTYVALRNASGALRHDGAPPDQGRSIGG